MTTEVVPFFRTALCKSENNSYYGAAGPPRNLYKGCLISQTGPCLLSCCLVFRGGNVLQHLGSLPKRKENAHPSTLKRNSKRDFLNQSQQSSVKYSEEKEQVQQGK